MPYEIAIIDNKETNISVETGPLADIDANVVTTEATTPNEIVEAADGADVLIVDAGMPVTGEVLNELDSLKIVGRSGVGLDNIDISTAVDNDITVVHTPAYCIEEVSTHALTLLLACARKLRQLDNSVRSGDWDWSVAVPLERLAGQTLGLVAFGKIPRRLVEKVAGFDFNIVAYDPYVDAREMVDYGVSKVTFEELLSQSDMISVHAPLTPETSGLFDVDAFEQVKDDAVIVNTGRGGVLDESALYEALSEGRLRGVGLDVMAEEPPGESPLFELENVLVSPHTAWYSEQSQEDAQEAVTRNIVEVLNGKSPDGVYDSTSEWLK
ncbi:putative D-2-hydroxyacid dehydrogenase (plasmid) [Haloferax gibbonsii]|uniref:D-2-hydroxyacid dehydrogenase n=1 Tax=Haloferax gibbonsii TaxID=35746 RepID=A0A871BMS3_HALGI|nr:C-terminal binding protein [Haloferax gibbonsii]QOS14096.1 putative D-2-hydroxyacid dehydrogenase [Haloferax gibbonsii]